MKIIYPLIRTIFLAAFVAACAADGGTENPIFRPFQWFSYANGDDIRENCAPGRNARYRMIYNAIYDEQVRTYDILQITTADSATQMTQVFSGGISVNWLLGAAGGSGPAATRESKVVISLKDLIAIEQALIKSGFEKPAIKGQILHSDEFYWIAMVCRDGNFKYYAWNDENSDVTKLPFREVLSMGDETGVRFQEPYTPTVFGRSSRYYKGGRGGGSTYFTLQIGDNGLDL